MSNEELVHKIKSGTDTDYYFTELCQQLKGLIYQTANRYSGYAELEDLLQESFLALHGAVQHFDEQAGVKFSSYVTVCIKRRLYRYINQNHMTDNNTVSLYTPIASDDEELCLCDTIAGTEDTEQEVLCKTYCNNMNCILWEAVDSLPDIQPNIIKLLYKEKRTAREAGEIVGLTRNNVANIKEKALRKLRLSRYVKYLKEYYFELEADGMSGTGNARFQRTWTSATERVALKHISNL